MVSAGGSRSPDRPGQLRDLGDHGAGLELRDARPCGAATSSVAWSRNWSGIEPGERSAERDGHLGGIVAAPVAQRQQEGHQPVLHLRGRAGDHAEVEQGEVPVVGDHHVARVRVGVEQAMHEDLVEVRREQRPRPAPGRRSP